MLAMRQGRMGVDAAIDATRLEEATQIEEWGLVEGGHDIDHSDLKVRVHPCSERLHVYAASMRAHDALYMCSCTPRFMHPKAASQWGYRASLACLAGLNKHQAC